MVLDYQLAPSAINLIYADFQQTKLLVPCHTPTSAISFAAVSQQSVSFTLLTVLSYAAHGIQTETEALRFVELVDMLSGHHILPRFRTKPEGHVSIAPWRLQSRNDSKDVVSSRESKEPLTQITEGYCRFCVSHRVFALLSQDGKKKKHVSIEHALMHIAITKFPREVGCADSERS